MMSPLAVTVILLWVVTCSSQHVDECDGDSKLVGAPTGKVCGSQRQSTNGSPYWAFRGLPYAKPPVGSLRFMDPVPARPWEGIRDGNFSAPVCPQLTLKSLIYRKENKIIGEEDCLYLDVYSPMGYTSKKLPVMVFLHPGGFLGGGGAGDYDPQMFMNKRVVFVVIQNRLNSLGFMSTGDKIASGNQALKDQELALRWIQDNIKAFGGDRNRVTLFRVSHGAVATHLQILNPRARGLFSRAILQSGTALMPIETIEKDHSKNITKKIASRLSCISEDTEEYDSQEIITCLQNLPVNSLLLVDQDYSSFNSSTPILFGPRIDGEVLPAHPAQLLKEGRYSQVDLISGVMKDEGLLYLNAFYNEPHLLQAFGMDWDRSYPNFASIKEFYLSQETRERFTQDEKDYIIGREEQQAVVDMTGNMQCHIPHDYVMQLHSRDTLYGKQVFAYEFHPSYEYALLTSFSPHNHDATLMIGHIDDLQYQFISPYSASVIIRKGDFKMSKTIIEMWTNFAADGNPTPDRSLGFIWKPVNLEKQKHLVLERDPHMEDDTRCQERKFWSRIDLPVSRILFPGDLASGKEIQWQYLNKYYQNC